MISIITYTFQFSAIGAIYAKEYIISVNININKLNVYWKSNIAIKLSPRIATELSPRFNFYVSFISLIINRGCFSSGYHVQKQSTTAHVVKLITAAVNYVTKQSWGGKGEGTSKACQILAIRGKSFHSCNNNVIG